MNFNNAIIITKKFVIGKLQPREKGLKVEMTKYECMWVRVRAFNGSTVLTTRAHPP